MYRPASAVMTLPHPHVVAIDLQCSIRIVSTMWRPSNISNSRVDFHRPCRLPIEVAIHCFPRHVPIVPAGNAYNNITISALADEVLRDIIKRFGDSVSVRTDRSAEVMLAQFLESKGLVEGCEDVFAQKPPESAIQKPPRRNTGC